MGGSGKAQELQERVQGLSEAQGHHPIPYLNVVYSSLQCTMSLSPLKSCTGKFFKMTSTAPIFSEISLFHIKIFGTLRSHWLRIHLASLSLVDFSNLNFPMKEATAKKSYFEVCFWQGSHLSIPKISTLADFTFLPISPRFLTKIRCRYFSLNK